MLAMKMTVRTATVIAASCTLLLSGAASGEPIELRVAGFFSNSPKQVVIEKAFFEGLAERTGIDIRVRYNNLDLLGLKMPDALRLVGSGAFDIMVGGLGNVGRDEPFLEGADIAGVTATADDLRKVDAVYRRAMNERLRERWNVRIVALWPSGPVSLFCAPVITGVDDLKGKKVRVYNTTQSLVISALGATAVTMQSPEVYTSLQRGVIDCAATSPSGGNTAKWGEITKSFVPLGLGWSMNAHFVNLNKWESFTPEQRELLTAQLEGFEEELWSVGTDGQQDAINCNTGREPCVDHTRYSLKLVPQTQQLTNEVKAASEISAVPAWAKTCESSYPGCVRLWNDTVGATTGISIN